MSDQILSNALQERFTDQVVGCKVALGEVTLEVGAAHIYGVLQALRDEADFDFKQLIDVCGVDYLAYGETEWDTESVSGGGFSRGRETGMDESVSKNERRFAAVYHLLSITKNQRLRVKVYLPDDAFPMTPSVVDLWPTANWFEREAFDLFGILFEGHPDLRRILTDYGFVGHPFRKDFPISGHVEAIFDEKQGRVIYQPVSIEPRVLVPRVIRHDTRFADGTSANASTEAGDA